MKVASGHHPRNGPSVPPPGQVAGQIRGLGSATSASATVSVPPEEVVIDPFPACNLDDGNVPAPMLDPQYLPEYFSDEGIT